MRSVARARYHVPVSLAFLSHNAAAISDITMAASIDGKPEVDLHEIRNVHDLADQQIEDDDTRG